MVIYIICTRVLYKILLLNYYFYNIAIISFYDLKIVSIIPMIVREKNMFFKNKKICKKFKNYSNKGKYFFMNQIFI